LWAKARVKTKNEIERNKNMKTIHRNHFLIVGLCAFALSLGSAAYAEKGGETLVRLTKGSRPASTEIAPATAHKCPNCTDSFVSVVDKSTKGPNHLVTKVVRHNCSACETKIVTEGTGKAKHSVAIHSCNAEIKPLCCAKN